MSTVQESSNDQTINLCSLGEELLTSYIKKGRDSVISKNEINTDSLENENEYPDFFKMLNTDASKCDEKWIVDFNQATNNASEEEIKKYGKQAIDMLSSIIYFFITQNKTEKKQENSQENNNKNDLPNDQNSSKHDSKNYYYYDEDFENDEILRELTEGLDPKYIDPDFNMIHSATIKQNNFDTYPIYNNGSKIYKTQEDIH